MGWPTPQAADRLKKAHQLGACHFLAGQCRSVCGRQQDPNTRLTQAFIVQHLLLNYMGYMVSFDGQSKAIEKLLPRIEVQLKAQMSDTPTVVAQEDALEDLLEAFTAVMRLIPEAEREHSNFLLADASPLQASGTL